MFIALTVATATLTAVRASAAPASDWVQAGRVNGDDGITIFVDMDSMIDAGPGRIRTWIRYRNDRPDQNGILESLAYEQLDCARDFHATISLFNYSVDGHVVSSEKEEAEDEDPIIPGSILAGILPFTCAAHGLQAR